MPELQGQLASQLTELTHEQRRLIATHAQRSLQILIDHGVNDPDWLEAVSHHHTDISSTPPQSHTQIDHKDLAQMLQYVDIFTAKICTRATRAAILPHIAARQIYMQTRGHTHAAALIKECGLYPPGCFVKLRSGEVGIVIRRGGKTNTPLVACLTNRHGSTLAKSIRRDTTHNDHSIISVIDEKNIMLRVPLEDILNGE